LEEPGRNVTGTTGVTPASNQIDLIKELCPEARKIGVIYNSSEQNVVKTVEDMTAYAESQDYEVVPATISSTNDLGQVAEQLATEVDVMWIPNDNTIASSMDTLIQITDAHQVPVFPVVDAMVKQGGVATVGINQYQIGLDTGNVIADVLEGADPATYPTVQTTKTDTYINYQQAEKLNITVPDDIRDEAIDVNQES